jgi:50S ribosomal protein L16 3-hydroxylase
MKPAGFNVRHFLRHHWQRKPLLIRQALPDFHDLINPEELAGLACESEVESRIVRKTGRHWSMQTGPFAETDFTSLPDRNWTLLVQAVDQFVPGAKALLHSLPFLPTWRLDDLMISYATPNGGVGPHFDYYDVFLVQGMGSRTWQLGQRCSASDILLTSSGLKLLKEFHATESVVLQQGDILYIPPGVAHWGTSIDNSISYSIGFRAPDNESLLLGYSDFLAAACSPDQRYTDPPLDPSAMLPGEIDTTALNRARRQFQSLVNNEQAFAEWFGNLMTQPRYPERNVPARRLPRLDKPGLLLRTALSSRIAWQKTDRQLLVSCNGETLYLDHSAKLQKLLQLLAAANAFPVAPWLKHAPSHRLLQDLLASGAVEEVKG